ncbi:U3 small nucleolar ribonucleoprotein protein Lcp5p [[Candida] anglica]|uniref:U3 small nucleolar ribonucleoprotein protein Lcp5p n=1 Tax=[Candida] anglica TaxID=148631 RepID=A0ABP0E5M2_9ASCO
MDELLKTIGGSLDVTMEAMTALAQTLEEENPVMIEELRKQNNVSSLEGVSLLALKNNSLMSYLNNAALVLLAKLQSLEGDAEEEDVINARKQAVENTIIQRVTLEKGVKPLEKRLSYQLDKLVRAYRRMETEETETREKLEGQQAKEGESGSESGSDDDSDSEADDNLAYKPDVQSLAKLTAAKDKRSSKDGSSSAAYKPPKISAVAPPKPTAAPTSGDNRKLQSMEEYLKENSDQPLMESSIGSTIVNHGKGGVKTNREKEKEQQIQTYEETNFTRLPNAATKKTFRQKQSELVNNFAGEDWSIFNNKRSISDSTSRKKKPNSAWDRVKKRRT